MEIARLRILIVEDEPAHAEAIRRALEMSGLAADTRVVGTLRDYREALAAQAPDIVLMDLNLPDGLAVETLTVPPEAGPFPILVMTSYGNERIAVETMKAGALDYVVKSAEAFDAIPRTVERALREWKTLKDHRLAEASLRESEEYYRSVFENSMDAVLVSAPDGRIIAANAAACRLFGRSETEICRIGRGSLVDPQDTRLRVWLEERARNGNARGEMNFLRADGSLFPAEVSSSVFDTPHGVRTSLIIHDLTSRKQSELELRRAYVHNRCLIETALDPLVTIGPDGLITDANVATAGVTGMKPQELIGTDFAEYFTEPEKARNIYRRVFAEGDVRDYELGMRRADGHVTPVLFNATVFRDAEGRAAGVFAAARDITERKRAEEQMRHAKEEWECTFDSVPDMICILNENYVIRRANRTMAEKLGLRPEELVGRTCFTLIHGLPNPPASCPHTKLLLDRREHTVEMHDDRLNGDFQVSCTPLREKDGRITGAVHIIRDTTVRKKLEAQLHQAMKMEAMGRLAGGVAHDFNNMLSVILGYTDMALARLNPLDPLYKDMREIERAGRRSADMTRQLLAFSRKQVVTPKVIDLNLVIDGQCKMLGRLIGEDIDFRFKPAPDLWLLKIDPSQIDQILANLAVNARDALVGVGAVTIETANVVMDETFTRKNTDVTPGEYVMLTFSDTGVGMDSRTMEQVFEPFFTTKEEGHGTGLGLATVYGIVMQYEGHIHVYSEPGMGTTFKIYLPRFRGDVEPTAEQPPGIPLAGSETVLIVEDEEQILNLARDVLSNHGYRVLTARLPLEACLLAEQHLGDIHLLLTDVIMPRMNGRDLQERVAKLKPGIRTIFMSGYTADIIAHRGIIDEGVEFLQKPFTVQSLAEKVRRVLDGKTIR